MKGSYIKLIPWVAVALGLLTWTSYRVAAQQHSQGQRLGRAAQHKNMRLLGHHDLQARSAYQPLPHKQGGKWIAYVGHHNGSAVNPLTGMVETNGTSIVDVTDPRNPVYVHHLPGVAGSQMVQVCDGSTLPRADPNKTYLLRSNGNLEHQVWDVTTPQNPLLVSTPVTGLNGTHKNWWDCKTGTAYLVSDGRPVGWRTSRMLQVFDLSTPASPVHIRNFGLVGQEPRSTGPVPPGLHEPTVLGNRVYLAYGTSSNGVLQIVDREKLLTGAPAPTPANLLSPQVGRLDMPSFWGGHTAWPLLGVEIPDYADNRVNTVRDFVVLVSESVANECWETRHTAFMVDITDESKPFPVSSFQVQESSGDFCSRGGRFGAHSTNWVFTDIFYKRIQFFSWFNAGVRAVDVRDPFNPEEVAFFIPATTENTHSRGSKVAIQTNNVEVDGRGYIYLADRANTGLHIVELTGVARQIANFP